MPEEPGLADVIAEQRELLSRLRAVVEAKDAEVAALRAELAAARERERRLELRLAELERRVRMDSSDSGTPSSKEPIGAKERRRALRQESERERRKDRRRGGQPGHPGRGLARDPDPGERKDADPPAGGSLVHIATQQWALEPWEGEDSPTLERTWARKPRFAVNGSRSCAELAIVHHLSRRLAWHLGQ